MKHFPSDRGPVHIAGLERMHDPAPRARGLGLLPLVAAFAAGFATAIYTLGLIVTRS